MTNDKGRVLDFLKLDQLALGYYRMHFGVGGYFASQGKDTFYPYAEVCKAII